MVGWHHWFSGLEFKQTPGDGEGQGSLACCSPWGRKESDTTGRLDNSIVAVTKSAWVPQPDLMGCQIMSTLQLQLKWKEENHPYFPNINLFIYNVIYLFIHLFLAALGLRCSSGPFSGFRELGLPWLWCTGFSLPWRLSALGTGSRARGLSSGSSWAPKRRLGSRGAQLLWDMWDLLGLGVKPVSPALAGGFFTTEPPGKPSETFIFNMADSSE